MHEMSIMSSLFRIIKEHAIDRGARRILSVSVVLGAFSGVDPDLLRSAFGVFSENSIADGAQFHIRTRPLMIKCAHCGDVEIELSDLGQSCPKCGGSAIDLPLNDELLIENMEIELDPERET